MKNESRLLRPKLAYERNFTQIPNEWLRDPRLGLRARGLLALLLSHEEGFVVTFRALANQGSDGEAAIRTAVAELKAADYLELRKERGRQGQILGTIWQLTDPAEKARDRRNNTLPGLAPKLDSPRVGNPAVGNPHVDKPGVENRSSIEEQLQEHLTQDPAARSSTRARFTGVDLDALASECPARRGKPHVFTPGSIDDWCSFCDQARADGSLYDRRGVQLRSPRVEAFA